MNQYGMNPEHGLVFRPVGRNLKVGRWSLLDQRMADPEIGGSDHDVRRIYHYDTLMGSFVRWHDECTWEDGDDDMTGPWHFVPVSVGHGSVSDQHGMNEILTTTGWRYRRNGGRARYEYGGVEMFPCQTGPFPGKLGVV